MIVPYSMLSEEVLVGIIEEFVSREGTDYGSELYANRASLADKVRDVMTQIKKGSVVVVFDEASDSTDIVSVGSARYKKMLAGA
jgi:uncharacterized protein YheU (UPF0270 family)